MTESRLNVDCASYVCVCVTNYSRRVPVAELNEQNWSHNLLSCTARVKVSVQRWVRLQLTVTEKRTQTNSADAA